MKTSLHYVLGIVFLFLTYGMSSKDAFGQDNPQKSESEYSRPSVTLFFTTFPGDNNSEKAALSAKKIAFTDKYFNHNLNEISIELNKNFKDLSYDAKKIELKKYLDKEGIGRKMIAKWFSRQPDGMFNLDYIHQCGLYNASDQDVMMSGAAKRGEAVLFDAGEKLVNKTYVLVISPKELIYSDDKTSHGWSSTFDVFLYKLNFDSEVVSRFYEQWPFDDDPANIKDAKIAAFDTLSFSLSSFYGKQGMSATSTEIYALTKNPKTSDQLLDEAVKQMYDDALFNIDKDLEPFRVKMNVSGTHPIRSKIGKKEGLRCDQRYFVYEYVWNEKTGTADQNRKAVVRATGKITDNRGVATGASGESKFYQVYGGTVRQGMVMQQRNDFGLSLIAGYEVGGIGGFDAQLWFRAGMFLNVPSLYLMADIGFDAQTYEDTYFTEDDFTFLRYSFGLGKGIRLARIVELTPYAAYGIESTSTDHYKDISTSYMKGGGILGINITHNLSIMGHLNFYAPFGNVDTETEDGDKVTEDFTWTDQFTDRSGMSLMFGLRLEF
ncbi:MAG: hypothetical protein EOM83_00835 [Clostridia bacterium]|nr:hypothetical protein [Clostridia bacterium]